MRSRQFILKLKSTAQLSSFQPLDLVQECLITRPMDRLWLAIKSKIVMTIKALDDESPFKEKKFTLKEIFLFELKKTADGGEVHQPVFYWISGNETMPEYDASQAKKYFKYFLAQKHVLTAIEIPPVEKTFLTTKK